MVSNSLPKTGREILLYRGNTTNASLSSTQRLAPSKYIFGLNQVAVDQTSTALTLPLPVSNGVVMDNGSAAWTGASGGTTTTNNVTTYKQGAGQTDVMAQNLLANSSSVTKQWSKEPTTSAATTTSYIGFWLYIKDATALAKFLTAGTSLTLRVGNDSTNYYYKNWNTSELTIGWNWMMPGILNTLSTTGTPAGTLDYASIIITTNNAADTFVAGDVVYDLLRQYTYADTLQAFDVGYPTFDYTKLEATYRTKLNASQANGFSINGVVVSNEDTAPMIMNIAQTNDESKGDTDELIYIFKNRMI